MIDVARCMRMALKRSWRLLRWHCLRCLFVVLGVPTFTAHGLDNQPTLGPFERAQPKELTVPLGDEAFDAEEALNGSFSSPEQCAKIPNGLWIEVEGRGDCIRYYSSGLTDGVNPKALIYFSGDVMLRTSKGVRHISRSYTARSPAGIEAETAEWSSKAQHPAIYLARSGIYGSSGDHNNRRHFREIALMNRALDALKKRYSISSFILVGHSAGGQIAAGLLNIRTDIEAAVISSGLVSVKQVSAFWENKRDIPGKILYNTEKFYDPIEFINNINKEPMPLIYIITDPQDRIVPFFSQIYYVRRLRSMGFKPELIYAYAPGPDHHLLAEYARRAAALIARGKTANEIRRALQELDIEHVE